MSVAQGDITGRELIRRQLKRLREAAGLSMQQFADSITYSKGLVADMESGRRLPSPELAVLLDERFRPLLTFTELLANVRDGLVAEHMKELLPQEKKAVRMQKFSSSVIPGLLQTEEYAWELSRKSMPGSSDNEISARVALRMEQQEILNRERPPYYWVIIHESALASPSTAMTAQLRKLEVYAQKDRVKLQILPMASGVHGMMGGSLALWHLGDGRTVALVESFGSGEPIENPARVSFYSEMFDEIKVEALSPDASLDLIRRYAKEYADD